AELATALACAAEFDQSFVPDALDVGTTFYGVRPGRPFTPRFGGESRAKHLAGGAKELCPEGIDSVRRDVDTPDDLRAAIALGLGRHTAAVVAELWPPS
ncbi:MAG TPA: 2-phospho-L-lactate guanylyltransferase, partial [Nonomuraea sp.]|nr:2-phospho-L-lactate guanylyltransferase [Nonomuraea sp.]